jgi:hypothetical protein
MRPAEEEAVPEDEADFEDEEEALLVTAREKLDRTTLRSLWFPALPWVVTLLTLNIIVIRGETAVVFPFLRSMQRCDAQSPGRVIAELTAHGWTGSDSCGDRQTVARQAQADFGFVTGFGMILHSAVLLLGSSAGGSRRAFGRFAPSFRRVFGTCTCMFLCRTIWQRERRAHGAAREAAAVACSGGLGPAWYAATARWVCATKADGKTIRGTFFLCEGHARARQWATRSAAAGPNARQHSRLTRLAQADNALLLC